MGFSGVFLWRRGAKKSKQSASGVLSWAALPPCLWFGRGFWRLCISWCRCGVCILYVSVFVYIFVSLSCFFWLLDPLCIHRFFAPMPPALPLFEFPPPLVCFWLEKHALVFRLFFFFFFSQCHLQGSRDGESSQETKLMCRLIFLTCLFQDCTHGFFY